MANATAIVTDDATTRRMAAAAKRASARKLAQIRRHESAVARLERRGFGDSEQAELLRTKLAEQLRATGRCCKCHRTLTDPESIAAGIGPECASKAA